MSWSFVDANEQLHFTNKGRENSTHRYKKKKKQKHANMMYMCLRVKSKKKYIKLYK